MIIHLRPPGMNTTLCERRCQALGGMPQSNGNGMPSFVISEVYIAEPDVRCHRDTGAENNSQAEHRRHRALRRKGRQNRIMPMTRSLASSAGSRSFADH